MLTNFTHSRKDLCSTFERKAIECTGALTEARRLVAIRSYGTPLNQLITHTYDLFDEIDEILLVLRADKDHEIFVKVAALYRQLEEIQSLIPRTQRGN